MNQTVRQRLGGLHSARLVLYSVDFEQIADRMHADDWTGAAAALLPAARALFPLGDPVEAAPWLGSRPCFADSRPVIGPAPGQAGLWLAFGHGHWGLTMAAVTGRLIAELMTGATPFVDPAPYRAERFM